MKGHHIQKQRRCHVRLPGLFTLGLGKVALEYGRTNQLDSKPGRKREEKGGEGGHSSCQEHTSRGSHLPKISAPPNSATLEAILFTKAF